MLDLASNKFREKWILHVRLGRGSKLTRDHLLSFAQFVGGHGRVRPVRGSNSHVDRPNKVAVLQPERPAGWLLPLLLLRRFLARWVLSRWIIPAARARVGCHFRKR